MHARPDVEAGGGHGVPEVGGVLRQPVAQVRRFVQSFQHRQAGRGQRRRQRVAEQVRPRALPEQLHDRPARRREPAGRAAERLAERAGDDVDLAQHAAVLDRAAAGGADEAGGVRVVHHHQRVVRARQLDDAVQRGDVAVHGEHAVGGDQPQPRAGGLLQLRLQVVHVGVRVAVAGRLAQADAVDDRRVVERVGEHRVAFLQQRLEQAAVGVEAGGVEDGVVGAQKARQRLLQPLVQVLRAADEAHGRQPEAVRAQRLGRRVDHRRIAGQSQVVVGAEVEHFRVRSHLARSYPDGHALRRGDDALVLVQAGVPDLLQGGLNHAVDGCHGAITP